MNFSTAKTKLSINYTTAMKKDLKRIQKRGYDMQEIAKVIEKLANDELLEELKNI